MSYKRIQIRNDASHVWTSVNPVLAKGELGIETDTNKGKIGDGTTSWTELPYAFGNAAGDPVAWGDIVGSLAANAPLVSALGAKQDVSAKGQPNGYAGLGDAGKIEEGFLPDGLEKTSNKGKVNGYAGLGSDGKLPIASIPSDVEKKTNKGEALGYAGLGADGKLLDDNLPETIERKANRGTPNGYAPLDSEGFVPNLHIRPDSGGGGTGGDIPRGGIIMWSGKLMNIPAGWALCDGTNGTPDLSDCFIVSVKNSTTDPGTRGGSNTLTIKTSNLPSHSHTFAGNSHRHTIPSHSHSMSGSTSTSVYEHAHSVQFHNPLFGTDATTFYSIWAKHDGTENKKAPGVRETDTLVLSFGTNTDTRRYTHGHSISGDTGSGGGGQTSSEAVSGSIGNTGGGEPVDNRPKYYALALIMKL